MAILSTGLGLARRIASRVLGPEGDGGGVGHAGGEPTGAASPVGPSALAPPRERKPSIFLLKTPPWDTRLPPLGIGYLSAYLADVRRGDTVIVCDRATPIARLVPYEEGGQALLVREPLRKSMPKPRRVHLLHSVDLDALLRESRDQR